MQKTLDVLSKELAAVRAGRANPAVLDKITVEYYGAPTPLNQVAAISTPDPRTLLIQPWDGSDAQGSSKRRSRPPTSASTRRTTARSHPS